MYAYNVFVVEFLWLLLTCAYIVHLPSFLYRESTDSLITCYLGNITVEERYGQCYLGNRLCRIYVALLLWPVCPLMKYGRGQSLVWVYM